ncbi:MAG: hypothetical protein RLY87_1709, partial [Chloroflexota bacterium]
MLDFTVATAHIPSVLFRNAHPAVPVRGVAYDSRKVSTGDVFVAYRGFHTDGHAHINDALARGAVAVIYE